MMEDLKHKWEQIDEDDYVAKYRDMRLRVEKMEEQQWWWAVYRGKEELCPEKPFARKKDYAMKMAEECAEENIEGYKVVRTFGGQAYEVDKFSKATRMNRQREMKVVVARALSATKS